MSGIVHKIEETHHMGGGHKKEGEHHLQEKGEHHNKEGEVHKDKILGHGDGHHHEDGQKKKKHGEHHRVAMIGFVVMCISARCDLNRTIVYKTCDGHRFLPVLHKREKADH